MSVRSDSFRSSSSHLRRNCSLRISDEISSEFSSKCWPSFINCCLVGLVGFFLSDGGGPNSFSILWSLFLKNSKSDFKHLLVRPKKSV